MYIKNDTIGVIFRVLFLIVCGAGLVMKLFASGFSLSVILGDFALLANALALVYFAYLIIYMVVTFLVYYYLNFGTGNGLHEGMSLAGYLLYFIAPLMAFIDYLLFCRKGEFTAYSPVFWAILPVLFTLAVFLVNRFGSSLAQIPYFNLLGLHMVLTLLVFLGISYLLFVLDNLMAGRRR